MMRPVVIIQIHIVIIGFIQAIELQTGTSRQFMAFFSAKLIGIQNISIHTLLISQISVSISVTGVKPMTGIGEDGTDALVLTLQQETVFGDDIHPLVVSGEAVWHIRIRSGSSA